MSPPGGDPGHVTERLRFQASGSSGAVSALIERPGGEAHALLVMAHGAGAGMQHPFMAAVSAGLCARGVTTFRFQFPYMEAGRQRPDPPALAAACVASAVAAAREAAPDLPIFAGGKSFGGRMTSTAASQGRLDGVRGLVFFGFPLHSPAKPGSERAAHLGDVPMPMLFIQGTRDAFARMDLLEPVLDGLGERAAAHLVTGADHGFKVLRSTGRSDDQVLEELAEVAASWMLGG
ncbi:MAG TPA: alpha/beta family hydrolase [Longimicrobiales bacterium]